MGPLNVLTLRQIEVLRAVMVTGSIAGAAKLLGVSAPGISRLMKYTERSLGLRVFDRRQGRYVPTPYAKGVFEQVNSIYDRVDDLKNMLDRMKSGKGFELRIGSVPSIANMMPRAVRLTRQRYPNIRADLNILKVEEAIDYIMLNKGELVAMSCALEHPSIEFVPLAEGKLYCIVPEAHPLAVKDSIKSDEMVRYPLIGIDPNDPYGSIMADIFRRKALAYDIIISTPFGTTVCSLVAAGLGIAVIDQYTVAGGAIRGIKTLEIEEPTWFQTYIAKRRDAELSTYAESFVSLLKKEMEAVNAGRGPAKSRRLLPTVAASGSAARARDEVLVADIVELSGGGASNGVNWSAALHMAVDEINQTGGLLGNKIVIQDYDTQTNPSTSRAMVQKALDEKPYVIMGPIYSGSVKVNMNLARDAKVPQFVGAQAGELTEMGDDYLFRANISQVFGMSKIANYIARTMKAKKVALVWVNNDLGRGGREILVKELKSRGLEVVVDSSIEFGQIVFTPEIVKIKSSSADVIFPYMTAEETARFVRDVAREGVKTPLAGETTLLQQNVIDLAGRDLSCARSHLSLTADAPDPLVQQFRKRFEARFKRTPDHNAISSYTAMYAVKFATEKAGKLDAELLAKTLHGLTVTTKDEPNVLLNSAWDAKGDLRRASYIGEAVDGKLKIVESVP